MYDHMDHAPVNTVDFWHFRVTGFRYKQGALWFSLLMIMATEIFWEK